ncbi:MAG TPA: SRPBCC family protein [Fimbriimonas sp.]|nr:SRPBCC family protein [Fimbriimonas sp.]
MSTYENSIDIEAPADLVYGFISNPRNLPQFLPQVNAVEVESPERITLVSGERRTEAAIHLDPDERTMCWNSLSIGYRGQFRVVPFGAGCRLTVTHTLDQVEVSKLDSESPGMVDQGQLQVLEKIRQLCEGQRPSATSKVESEAM